MVGVKVATVFWAFMATVPDTLFPVVSLSVNVSSFPAGNELIVAGSIGWLKVAVTVVPVTMLLLLLVLVGALEAPLLGLVEVTLIEASAPLMPHTVSSDAINHVSGLKNLFIIFFLSSFGLQGTGYSRSIAGVCLTRYQDLALDLFYDYDESPF